MSALHNQLLPAILRKDLSSFIQKVFNCVNPGGHFEHNWHIDLLADYLKNICDGNIKRLIINIPPRSLKSICVSVALPAWALGLDPTKRIIAASYSQVLAVKHSLDCRFVINSEWYQELFPATVLSKSHNQKSKFLTIQNGFRFASSVLGSITGEGGDLLIIDDPHKPIDVNSPKKRTKVVDWFEQTFVTRLNDKNRGAIIIVMQRLHAEDLTGYLLQNSSNWECLKIPAIANKPITFQIQDSIYNMEQGEILHQTRDNTLDLFKLEQEIGKVNFSAQYLQNPLDNEEVFLKEEDISFYENNDQTYEYYVQSWDTAIKTNFNSDYSVCLTFGIIKNIYYLVHILREKLDYPRLKQAFYSLKNKFLSQYVLIEDKSSGQQLIQDARIEGCSNIIPIKPKLDKVTRFATIIEEFRSGRVLLSRQGNLQKLIIKELTTFPYSKNDDAVDAISQFLHFMKEFNFRTQPRVRVL